MTLFANARGRDAADMYQYYYSPSSWYGVGTLRQSSSTFTLMKYELCSTEA